MAWIREGLARSHLAPEVTARLVVAVVDAPVATAHGDALVRNLIAANNELVLVDWECAGRYVADWDLALFATQLAPPAWGPIDRAIGDGPRRAAFDALVAFALVRELRFLAAFPDPSAAEHARLRDALRSVLHRGNFGACE